MSLSSELNEYYRNGQRKRKEEEKDLASELNEVYRQMSAEESDEKIRRQGIGHVYTPTKEEKEGERTWFTGGAFEDGYQFGDLFKTMYGSGADLVGNVAGGLLEIGEGVVDAGAFIAGAVGGAFGAKDFAEGTKEFIANDLYSGEEVANRILTLGLVGEGGFDDVSIWGEKVDSLAQSGGQLVGTIGLQAVGVPWWLTSGVTSFGQEVDRAFDEGADYLEAGTSGIISAGAEILTEKLFGGSGLGEKGLINLEPLTKGISSKIVRALAGLGVDMAAEGTEEFISSVASKFGEALYSEKNLGELLTSEEALDEYLESFLGGAALGGIMNSAKVNKARAKKGGYDYRTGLNDNEQAVFDNVYEAEIEEREKGGEKLSKKDKAKLYDKVMKDLSEGQISTDAIEEILGGESLKAYKDAVAADDAAIKELERLYQGEELEARKKDILDNSKANELKTKLGEDVFSLVEKSRLGESYREKARLGVAYDTDLSQYSEKQQAFIKKAIDSKVLNNTRRTHRFVDMLANLYEGRDIDFDFTNNEKLKSSSFAVDGAIVNGYKTADGNAVLNLDSPKYLNSVVGHEVTHVLEGTKLYDELRSAVEEFAQQKGEYDARLRSAIDLYKNLDGYKGAEGTEAIKKEVVADLVGDYLFTDENFVKKLYAGNRNLFQKIWDEVKYLYDTAVAAGHGERKLLEVKRAFEKAYQEGGKAEGGVKHSLGYTTDNRTVAIIEDDIFGGRFDELSESERIKIAKDAIKGFRPGVPVSGRLIGVTRKSAGHFTNSDYTDKIRNNDKELYKDKLNVARNIDDVIYASTDYINEPLKHQREDNITQFARGSVLLDIGGKKYEADVIVGYTSMKEMLLYDVQDLIPTKFDIKKEKAHPKLAGNESDTRRTSAPSTGVSIPQSDPSVNGGVVDFDGSIVSEERISPNEGNNTYSLSHNKEIEEGQSDYVLHKDAFISAEELAEAQKVTNAMVDVMMKYSSILPEDKIGKVLTKNGSYDRSVENTTICVRTLAYNEFVDKVQEQIGRPLTQMESFLVSQKLYDIATEPQCLYCYVSLDRKAFNDMLLRYMTDRDTVIEKYNNSDKSPDAIAKLYEEFLNGRKDTKNMKDRFNKWISYVDNGTQLLSLADIATEDRQTEINANGGILAEQLKDARAYAQSASWSKIQKNYVAYRDEILKLGDRVVKNLNEHYGMRWYSFSDYSAAFIVENMQQITDASIRGLKGLAYTKDTDFAEVFAPSGMNINVSVFVNQDENGNFYIDEKQSANFEKALELRERYPNVGIVATVTNDDALRWAGEQGWSDVIIPFHIVRTGMDVAEYYKWLNYTSESADTVGDKDLWDSYLDSLNLKSENARKKVSKNIYPNEHKNNKETYLSLCESRGLTPRFVRFAGEPWYMKLVNETRLSADESTPLKPNYNLEAAKASFQRFVDKGGYEGGWYKDGVDVDSEAAIVASDVLAGKKANEVDYGRQDQFDPEAILGKRKNVRTHGNQTYSLSSMEEHPIRSDGFNVTGEDLRLQELEYGAPIREDLATEDAAEVFEEAEEKHPIAKVLTEEPESKKKKSRGWSKLVSNIFDKGAVFETLSLKSKNRELQAKYNNLHYSEGKAQRLIGKGSPSNGVRALTDIQAEVEKSGLTEQFYDYMYHKLNVDRMTLQDRFGTKNKPVFGDDVTAEDSRIEVAKLETMHPEFKRWASDMYAYNNLLRKVLVDGGVISQKTADLFESMYPSYVPIGRVDKNGQSVNVPLDTRRTGVNAPIRRATGGNSDIRPLFKVMAERTLQTYKAAAKNSFGLELMNTLGTVVDSQKTGIDETLDGVDNHEELLQKGKNGASPTFTVFENGQRVTFEITEDMYDALKPTSEGLAHTYKIPSSLSKWHKNILTEYNPAFLFTNAIKDAQDVLMNSQHAAKTYASIPKAVKELWNAARGKEGRWYTEYMENGGEQNTYFDNRKNSFTEEKSGLSKVIGMPLEAISAVNNFIERIPRLAEYIASRESGRSIDVSMLDAARVTTNFAAGGDVTKFFNRNGATFLNASVQGFMQNVRNIREAKHNGLKGWALLATKAAGIGLAVEALNHLLWDDDDEYEELSDYVKQNYYVVAKTADGQFVRIPKGRTLAVIQNAFDQVINSATGNDEADLGAFLELAVSNLAPNNPIDNNIFAPIGQVISNKTWYGEDLVPTRLQDLPKAEQYDESTDAISKWLGEQQSILSPYQINYLLDQYSGGLGDVFLPMLTPEAERGEGNPLIAPFTDKFSTDSVINNQNVSDFYAKMDELTTNAKSSKATDEDVLKYKFFNAVNSELGDLYQQKREIQNSTLSDSAKFAKIRELQEQINSIARDSLKEYENTRIDGVYATVGDIGYHLHTSEAGEQEWKKITDKQLAKQEEVTSGLGITPSQYWSNKEEWDYAYENPEKYYLSKAVTNDLLEYREYTKAISEIKADKDKLGNALPNSRKKKVESYINGLDLSYEERIVLFKSVYPSETRYDIDIVEYINGIESFSYEQKTAALKALGFKIGSDGKIYRK